MERRNDERDRLRQATRDEIRELREADEDEDSTAMVDVAARAAARTARHLSRPDSDPPPEPWHRKPAAKGGAVIALLSVLAAVVEALRQAGIIR